MKRSNPLQWHRPRAAKANQQAGGLLPAAKVAAASRRCRKQKGRPRASGGGLLLWAINSFPRSITKPAIFRVVLIPITGWRAAIHGGKLSAIPSRYFSQIRNQRGPFHRQDESAIQNGSVGREDWRPARRRTPSRWPPLSTSPTSASSRPCLFAAPSGCNPAQTGPRRHCSRDPLPRARSSRRSSSPVPSAAPRNSRPQ
jgi:hypothetical protein